MDIHDIEDRSRAPNTKTVLSDLLDWMSERPGEAFSNLVNWQMLDFPQMRLRLERDRTARPRIEVSAHITKMNNLSVRWHPGGWKNTEFDWNSNERSYFNLITHRKWEKPPDFRWFCGDEDPTFNSRPSNELMYVRGVGNLRPEPREGYGIYNRDVVDSILICAVRSAYEGLIKQLDQTFEVDVIDVFDFVTREEVEDNDRPFRCEIRRVVDWSLENAAELRAHRERLAAAEQEQRERAELKTVEEKYGFTIEMLIESLLRSLEKKATGPAPSGEHFDRTAAKYLREAGYKIDAGGTRHLRQLIEKHSPGLLPESLKTNLQSLPPLVPTPGNVLPFPASDSRSEN